VFASQEGLRSLGLVSNCYTALTRIEVLDVTEMKREQKTRETANINSHHEEQK
jgi:hypothetical protein